LANDPQTLRTTSNVHVFAMNVASSSVWTDPGLYSEPVEGPPYPRSKGGLTYAQGPHIT